MNLADKTAVVVGGGTGIGLAIARALAEVGARLVIGGRREEVLQQAAAGTSIKWRTLDVGNRSQVDEFFTWTEKELGRIDIMVNAAGINIKDRSMQDLKPEQWDRVLNINATGAYNCMHAVLPGMKTRRSGTIINISSVAGKRAIALGGIAYAASKFAMTALGITVANEVAVDGIRITNVYPGEVNTPILEERPTPVTEEHRQRILQPEDVAELVLSIIALPPKVHVPEVIIKPLSQQWY